MDSITFIEKHLNNILNVSSSNNEVLFIINRRCNSQAQTKAKDNIVAESKIKVITDTFNLNPIYLNLSNFYNDDPSIKQFLSNLLTHKIADTNNQRQCDKHKSKQLASETPSRLREIQISNLNPPHEEVSKSLNITQKRTRSGRKNLSDKFEKLNLESI